MRSERYTIRYCHQSPSGGAAIVEDEWGDLYACTGRGLFARIPGPRLAPLIARGWVAADDSRPLPLAAILRALATTP